jgi:hypothetical protein
MWIEGVRGRQDGVRREVLLHGGLLRRAGEADIDDPHLYTIMLLVQVQL